MLSVAKMIQYTTCRKDTFCYFNNTVAFQSIVYQQSLVPCLYQFFIQGAFCLTQLRSFQFQLHKHFKDGRKRARIFKSLSTEFQILIQFYPISLPVTLKIFYAEQIFKCLPILHRSLTIVSSILFCSILPDTSNQRPLSRGI